MGEAIAYNAPFFLYPGGVSATATQGIAGEIRGSATTFKICLVESDPNTRPVVIRDVPYRGRTFHFRSYLTLHPTYDETEELLCLEYAPLGIHVFADTREGLGPELAEQICMLWDEYACEIDENLTPAAIQLKRSLLSAVEEV